MKFDIICADPPWSFSDTLSMSSVKRGAKANYPLLDIEAIKNLKVGDIAADNAVLALWVPSSLLQEGLDTMKAWGFKQTQSHIWVKIKNKPFEQVIHNVKRIYNLSGTKTQTSSMRPLEIIKYVVQLMISEFKIFDFDNMLAFGMGHLFRQTHEICLVGVKGKVYNVLKNKSQRSVHFDVNKKHSAKPEILQDRLELMYPNAIKLEMFARRSRPGWTCIGLECPDSQGIDIRDSLDKLATMT